MLRPAQQGPHLHMLKSKLLPRTESRPHRAQTRTKVPNSEQGGLAPSRVQEQVAIPHRIQSSDQDQSTKPRTGTRSVCRAPSSSSQAAPTVSRDRVQF